MNNQRSDRSKRLLKTRQEFSQLTKTEVNKWKRIKQIKDNKRLDELQNQEIGKINQQLTDLRAEYKRIALERGSAHKWALIVAKHESDANEFEKRRNAIVFKRSKETLNQFIDENTVKQNNIQIEKQNQILRRKQLMKSSLAAHTTDKEVIDILRQLNDLKKSESVLKKVIQKKTELSPPEKPIQMIAEKLVPKQKFLDSKVSTKHSKDLNNVCLKTQTKTKTFENKENQNLSEILKVSPFDDKSDEYLPISIATKLYQRLRTHQNHNKKDRNSSTNDKKIYRNIAISTSPQNISLELNEDSDKVEKSSIDWSQQTSYLSVPTAPHVVTNKATTALSQMYKNLNNRLNCFENKSEDIDVDTISLQDLTLADNSVNSVDPLMARINNLKQLIDKKVGKRVANERQASKSGFDLQPIASNPESLKDLDKRNDSEEASEETFFNDLDAISCSSLTSFKTLQASTSSRSSSSVDSSFQVLDILNKDFDSIASNGLLFDSLSNQIYSNNSSFINCEPLRDRNAFWKDVFERAGIEIDANRINELFPSLKPESEPTVDTFASFTLSSFSTTDPNSHSTPKR